MTTAALHVSTEAGTPGRCRPRDEVRNTSAVLPNAPIPARTPKTAPAHRARARAPWATYNVPPTVSISVHPSTKPQASSAFFNHLLRVLRTKFPVSTSDSFSLLG